MKRQLLILGFVALSLTVAVIADDKHDHATTAPTNAGFEKMKALVGTWVAADENRKLDDQVVSVIKPTAGGSAIHETLFLRQPQEMVSVYTAEGSDLVMTHYCMLGNQPRMKANTKSPGKKLNFEFAGGTNLDPK